jgi:glutathione S-transferase
MTARNLMLFELAGADQSVRFSPHCWKIRMALAHKGLMAQGVPWRFTDKAEIAFSEQTCVPVLVDDGVAISDSWRIAQYLETHFPHTPPLAGEDSGLAACAFINHWADATLLPALARVLVPDVYHVLHPKDRPYFRISREARLGMTIEQLATHRQNHLTELKRVLAPLRATLKGQPFVAGDAPNYADYCVFGMFMWSRCVSDIAIVEPNDPIYAWCERLLDLFDGFARKAPIHSLLSGGTTHDQPHT